MVTPARIALPPQARPPGSPNGAGGAGPGAFTDAHLAALHGIQAALNAALNSMAASMAASPDALLRQQNWSYYNLVDRASSTLAAGNNRPIWQGKGTGWLQTFRVVSNSKNMRLRIAMGYPGGGVSELNVSPAELQADGHTRPTQTVMPYNTLFDDVAVLYGMAVDVPWPGHPYQDTVLIRLDNPTGSAITVSAYALRAIVVEPTPR